MTAYTANTSGKASASATWSGVGHPSVNGDTFVINVGIDVEWDLDLTGLTTGLGASTINGTLHFSRTAGAYGFKMNAATLAVSGTGTLDASDGSGGAYPANCTATIVYTGAGNISTANGSVINLISQAPTHKFVRLSQAESATATTIHVDTDVSSEALYWKNGDLIRVDNVHQGQQSEQYVISGTPTSTTITLTVGLTNGKDSGSYVVLVIRNVKINGAAAISGTGITGAAGAVITYNAELRLLTQALNNTNNPTIDGVISGCTNVVIGGSTVGGVWLAVISGCTNSGMAIQEFICNSPLISGCSTGWLGGWGNFLNTIFTGCTSDIVSAAAELDNCSLKASQTGIVGQNAILRNCLLGSDIVNTRDLNRVSMLQAFNCLFASAIEFLGYNSAVRAVWAYAESFDHDQVAGAYRNWCRGGITSSNVSTVYPGRTRSYQHALELGVAGSYSFRDQTVEVPAGGWVNVTAFLQKDASMSYLPNLQIFAASVEPLIAGSPGIQVNMTNSTNTWEVLTAKLQNTTTAPQLFKVRVIGQNASGSIYEDTDINVSPFGYPQAEAA